MAGLVDTVLGWITKQPKDQDAPKPPAGSRSEREAIIQQVDKIIPVEKDCSVPKEVIEVHNEAARMNKAIEELRQGAKK